MRDPNTFIHSTASHSALHDLINKCCQPRKLPTYKRHETISTYGRIRVIAVSIISPEEKAEDFRAFPVTTRKYGLYRENVVFFLFTYIPFILILSVFYSPNNTQVNCIKNKNE